MRGKTRPEPIIPDHEVLRKIGGGSYGEVWLAQGVTGAMRAVKVVRREDFEDERGFEREFEGILKYEPISRSHPGLVNVLHVGRSSDVGQNEFYYYVMELGEDIRSGREIHPVEYEPRNLRTDLKKADGEPIALDTVIDVGLCLAEALQHLHEKGLAHRDIKPSNIIFVDGKAKLADIGLVAARGQRTFVGTEGFVPPEGPGSAQADVYGLGKVLYEMATGKDRLDFPELPDQLPENQNIKRWNALNQVICDICEPRVSKRTIKTASALADALRRLQRGQRIKRRRSGRVLTLIPVVACLLLVGWLFRDQLTWPRPTVQPSVGPILPAELKYGFVKVISEPEGVEVYDGEGNFVDITPMKNIRMLAGQRYEFEFRMEGYRTERAEGYVPEGDEIGDRSVVVEKVMSIYSPPVLGEEWVDNFGIHYLPVDGYHISSGFVRSYQWKRFVDATKAKLPVEIIEHSESGVLRKIIVTTQQGADAFCRWHTENAANEGYLNEAQFISARFDRSFSSKQLSDNARSKNLYPFQCVVKNIPFAQLEVNSVPEGATIIVNGEYQGITPKVIRRLRPGQTDLIIQLEGYRKASRSIKLDAKGSEKLSITLKRDNSVVFGKPWTNSLNMKLVPVGEDLMVSAWETRCKDYAAFAKATNAPVLESPEFEQGPNHPVVNVSRDDGVKFCQWLTQVERKAERISDDMEYRLLTDYEWSQLNGMIEDLDAPVSLREFRPERLLPWGMIWPPEDAGFPVGNLADQSAAKAADIRRDRTLLNYDDGFEKTSPVGSFAPNDLGIYDLAGNASEWVNDNYDDQGVYGVLRGGGWNSYLQKDLFVTARNVVRVNKTSNTYGFRVALARKKKIIEEGLTEETEEAAEPTTNTEP